MSSVACDRVDCGGMIVELKTASKRLSTIHSHRCVLIEYLALTIFEPSGIIHVLATNVGAVTKITTAMQRDLTEGTALHSKFLALP